MTPGAGRPCVSAGGGTSRYPEGTSVTVPAVMGHRDVGQTACPGRYLYGALDTVRSRAASVAAVTMPFEIGGSRATPLAADVDGDGQDDVGWFLAGQWSFRLADGRLVEFGFGRAGDVPVVGDWDDDGRWGVGVFRSGTWHLRQTASGGAAERSTGYGRRG